MTTLEMEVAIMEYCNVRQNIVVPNASFGMVRWLPGNTERGFDELHECDILKVTPAGYATEFEIKVSKSDFLADKKKKHSHDSNFIKELYYAVPYEMLEFAKENLPEGAGLIYVKDGRVRPAICAKIRDGHFKWTDKEMFKLSRLGAMRISTLKKSLLRAHAKWKTKQNA